MLKESYINWLKGKKYFHIHYDRYGNKTIIILMHETAINDIDLGWMNHSFLHIYLQRGMIPCGGFQKDGRLRD